MSVHLRRDDDLPSLPGQGRLSGQRRSSVFSESPDPEQLKDFKKIVGPKTQFQREFIKKILLKKVYFQAFEDEIIEDIIDVMIERSVAAHDVIVNEGEDGNHFYVVQRGSFFVYVKEGEKKKFVHVYEPETTFGEVSLLYSKPYPYTIKAVTSGTLWVLERSIFRNVIIKKRHDKKQKYDVLLSKVPCLKNLEYMAKTILADSLKTLNCENDKRIIRKGEYARGLYIVEEGQVRLSTGDGISPKEEVRLRPGDYFGNLKDEPVTQTATAVGKTKVVFLDSDVFNRLAGPVRSCF